MKKILSIIIVFCLVFTGVLFTESGSAQAYTGAETFYVEKDYVNLYEGKTEDIQVTWTGSSTLTVKSYNTSVATAWWYRDAFGNHFICIEAKSGEGTCCIRIYNKSDSSDYVDIYVNVMRDPLNSGEGDSPEYEDISGKYISLSQSTYEYNGKYRKPAVTVSGLTEGEDYIVSYSGNKDAGTATVTVKGIGSYCGTISRQFTITPYDISRLAVSLSSTEYEYDGNAARPYVIFDGFDGDVNYTVRYENNISGPIALAVIEGTGNFTGRVEKKFKILPESTEIKSLTPGKACMTVRLYKQSRYTSGYQIRYSTSRSMTNCKRVTLAGTSNLTRKITNLKGHRYYVEARTYREYGGVRYYSPWGAMSYTDVKPKYSPETVLAAYKKYLRSHTLNPKWYKEEPYYRYTLRDMNSDGIKECLVTYYNGGARGSGAILTYKNGKVVCLKKFSGQPVFFKISGSTNISVGGASGAAYYSYTEYSYNGSAVSRVCTYTMDGTDGELVYYKGKYYISRSEFMSYKNKLTKMKLVKIR